MAGGVYGRNLALVGGSRADLQCCFFAEAEQSRGGGRLDRAREGGGGGGAPARNQKAATGPPSKRCCYSFFFLPFRPLWSVLANHGPVLRRRHECG